MTNIIHFNRLKFVCYYMTYWTTEWIIDIFRKLMIRHWWHSVALFLLISSQKCSWGEQNRLMLKSDSAASIGNQGKKTSSFKRADCSNELTWQRKGTQNEWEGPRERVRPWDSGVGSAVHCSGVTSDNGPAVNGPAVTSRNCVFDPRKNETLDVVTSKMIQKSWRTMKIRKNIQPSL